MGVLLHMTKNERMTENVKQWYKGEPEGFMVPKHCETG